MNDKIPFWIADSVNPKIPIFGRDSFSEKELEKLDSHTTLARIVILKA